MYKEKTYIIKHYCLTSHLTVLELLVINFDRGPHVSVASIPNLLIYVMLPVTSICEQNISTTLYFTMVNDTENWQREN